VVSVQLRIHDGQLADAWFDGDGCCISQASASMLLEALEGKTIDEVKEYTAQQLLELFGPRLTPMR